MLGSFFDHLDDHLLSDRVVSLYLQTITDDLHVPATTSRQVVPFQIQFGLVDSQALHNVTDDQGRNVPKGHEVAQLLESFHQHQKASIRGGRVNNENWRIKIFSSLLFSSSL